MFEPFHGAESIGKKVENNQLTFPDPVSVPAASKPKFELATMPEYEPIKRLKYVYKSGSISEHFVRLNASMCMLRQE